MSVGYPSIVHDVDDVLVRLKNAAGCCIIDCDLTLEREVQLR